jgi:squalene-hopene/tetraprenyl-beta-curcumene cyclase
MRSTTLGSVLAATLISLPVFAAESGGTNDVRSSAQLGLDYLGRVSASWTAQHKCYGCHVQAVTLEGFAVGKHNQYKVTDKDLKTMVDAMLLGVTAGGRRTGAAFQGAAWARYDQWEKEDQTEQLLKYGRELISYQSENGAVEDDDRRPPVVAGTIQTTFQAMQTWRQAFARTADEIWLLPLRKAETYISKTAGDYKANQYVLDVNYALMALISAGVRSTEPSVLNLQRFLLARQNQDGGFGLEPEKSDALATGQTLYALKLAGMSDRDPVIAKAMRYLIKSQEKNGGWKTVSSAQHGADKGEAMWAVLGLVTVDVMSIALDGVRDGQHVAETMKIDATANDNQEGGSITSMDLLIDDLLIKTVRAGKIDHVWNTKGLSEGKHLIDIVAKNKAGKISRKRIEVYAGNVFMTHVGTRFDETRQITEASLRNISEGPGKVRFDVLNEKGERLYRIEKKSEPGATTFAWDGNNDAKKMQPKGRYTVKLAFVGKDGKVLQEESSVIFHDTAAVQHEKFGEVEGKIKMKDGLGFGANAVVELVDKTGNVVQSTRSTEQGNYRFKSVHAGGYTVRVKKEGFKPKEAKVETEAKAAPAAADVLVE